MLTNEHELQGRITNFLRRKTNKYPELDEATQSQEGMRKLHKAASNATEVR
jgi:hypothetical protein